MAEEKKMGVQDYLDALVDKEGLKTEVKITMTDETLWKVVLALVGAGISMALAAHLIKNVFPNRQLTESNRLLTEIKQALTKS